MYNYVSYNLFFIKTKMNSLEQLETKASKVKDELNALKTETLSLDEKKKKAEELRQQADKIKTELQKRINELDAKNDATIQSEKAKAEQLLHSLEETTSLCAEILSNSNITPTNQNNPEKSWWNNSWQETMNETNKSPDSQQQEENKGFLDKTKDAYTKTKNWIWDQWNDVWDKEKWKTEWWKNLLRTAWFVATWVWAVSLAYKWIKKLFWWWKDDKEKKEEGEEKSNNKEEKKWFRDKWYWKAIKWTAIWVSWALGINRLGKKFWWWGTEANATSSAEKQVESTEKLKDEDPEKFEKYRELWSNIDSQYNQLMEKEITSGWGGMSIADWYKKYCDNSKLSFEDFKATVPMCIDNQFSSVSNMLSEAGYYAYLRTKNFKELKEAFLKMLSDWSDKLIWSMTPFFGCLKSFEKYKNKDFLSAIKIWLDDWAPTERCEELQLFFRQYAKVINYAQDKRLALVEKIAKRKLSTMEEAWVDISKYATINDAINDEKWFEENIKSDNEYVNFMEWKLTNSIDVMKKESLFDDKLSEGVKEIKTSVDSYRADILKEKDWKDSLYRLKQNKESLSEDNYNEWMEVVDNVCKDIDDYFEKDWTYMYFSGAHTLINSDEKNKQEFLTNSWLKTVKDNLKTKLLEYKTKLKDKKITPDEVEWYSDLVNSYFAMKKEVMVASQAIQTMKSNDASRVDRALNTWAAILHDYYEQWKKAWESVKKWDIFEWWLYSTIPLLTAWWIAKVAWRNKAVKNIWDFLIKRGNVAGALVYTVPWLLSNVSRRTSHIEWLPDWTLVRWRYNIEHGGELLCQDVLEWRISWAKAERIISSRKWWEKIRGKGKSAKSLDDLLKEVWKLDKFTSGRVVSDLFNSRVKIWWKEVEISFMKNEEIRKMICWTPEKTLWKRKSFYNWYSRRQYNLAKMEANAKQLWFWELFWRAEWSTSKIKKLSENQLIFLKRIIEDWNLTDPTKQLKSLFNNIDQIDLKWVTEEGLIKIIEEIWSNPTDLEDIAKIQNRVNKFKSAEALSQQRLSHPIFSDIDNTKWALQDELNRCGPDTPKGKQIKKQIDQLEEFKQEIWSMPDDEFKRMGGILECFQSSWSRKSLNEVITEATKLRKIMDTGGWAIKLSETWVLDSAWRVVYKTKTIEEIINELDVDSLRQAKRFHWEIASELEDIAKIFEQIKIAKNANKISWNLVDIAKWIKLLTKLAKAT